MFDWFSRAPWPEPHLEDDLEHLFHRLPQLEPSEEVMERLFAAVRSLPGPLQQAQPKQDMMVEKGRKRSD